MAHRLAASVRRSPRAASIIVGLLGAALALPLASRAEMASDGQVSMQTPLGRSEAAAAERHIATLHTRLHITAEQEPLWQPLAEAMRKSVAALDDVYAQRGKAYGSMSAVDDLKAYEQVQETHARNVENLIAPFERLYDSFSPAQKKQADETFRRFTETAVKNSR